MAKQKICIGLTVPAPPQLPTGFSISLPPLPPIPDLNLCCQIHLADYLPPIPPLPFPTTLTYNPAILQTINAAMVTAQSAIQAYIDSLVPECPKIPRPSF